jgi:stearoyl-CoA desaturase (delta-9 desaturase)
MQFYQLKHFADGERRHAASVQLCPSLQLGRRRFESSDESRNVWWLSWISFGESWHNNHHAFPTSAFHGLRKIELDPGGWLILALERTGLAWKVTRVAPERPELRAIPQ